MAKSGFAKDHLKAFIDRIERMESEKAALVADIGEIYKEARGMGFDTKIIRKVVALRKLDTADFQEQMALLDMYLDAAGMGGTPLGDYVAREPVKAAEAPKPAKAAVPKELKAAVARLGTPVPTTDEEKEKGVVAAFEKDGTRMSIGFDPPRSAPQAAPTPSDEIPSFLDRRNRPQKLAVA